MDEGSLLGDLGCDESGAHEDQERSETQEHRRGGRSGFLFNFCLFHI